MSVRKSSRISSSMVKNIIEEYNQENQDNSEESLCEMILDKQIELDKCVKNTKSLSPAKKKRLRNAKASAVSRLKKKLFVLRLNNELEKTKKELREAQTTIKILNKQIKNLKEEKLISSNDNNLDFVNEIKDFPKNELENLCFFEFKDSGEFDEGTSIINIIE